MRYINDSQTTYNECGTIVTIGNFDGFHNGHKKLISSINTSKNEIGAKSLLLSFYPRPLSILKSIDIKSIFVKEERVEIAKSLDIDILVEYPFSKEFAAQSGYEFVNMLKNKYNCRQIVVGEDFAFGKNRMWNACSLAEIAKDAGIAVTVNSHKQIDGRKISSTDIRNYLESGNVEEANRLLGHDYFIQAIAKQGRADNRNLGASFINIFPQNEKLLPTCGLYSTQITLENGKTYSGITKIEENGLLANSVVLIETYIQNLSEKIYNTEIKIEFKKLINEI